MGTTNKVRKITSIKTYIKSFLWIKTVFRSSSEHEKTLKSRRYSSEAWNWIKTQMGYKLLKMEMGIGIKIKIKTN